MARKGAGQAQDRSLYLTIGEAAESSNVSPGTLRNWDRAGKLKPHRHPMNCYRLYRSKDIEALKKAIRNE